MFCPRLCQDELQHQLKSKSVHCLLDLRPQHFEISAALPFSNVRMSVVSQATIVPNSFAPQPPFIFNRFNFFQPTIAQATPPPNITVPNCPPAACVDAVFYDSRRVTGLGDVVFVASISSTQENGWELRAPSPLVYPPETKRISSVPARSASSPS